MWILIPVVLFVGLVLYTKWQNSYFPKNGIKTLPVYEPFFGNAIKLAFQREHFFDFFKRVGNIYPNEKYFGIRNFSQPIIILKDLEIIKQVAIKDFDYFMNRFGMVDDSVDKLFGSNLAALKGQKWRDMRGTLSPAFTSSKMKGMFDFVSECGDQMSKYFQSETEQMANKDKKIMEIELKDIFTRYTNDVIATSAFGVTVNSVKDRENEFYEMGKKATNFTGFQLIKILSMMSFPRLSKLLKFKVFGDELANFFKDLVQGSMKIRETQGIVRHDMIQLLMEAKKGSLKHDSTEIDDKDAGFATVEESDLGKETIKRVWTNDEIVAQAIIFFFAGFETSSTLLCFMGYELAKNPDIQKRLQEEIDEIAEKNNGKVKYEDLQHMKYMDMVVSETLRYWPPAIVTDRKCVKPYTLPPSNNVDKEGGKVNVGDGLWIPIYAIHHDPQYYKDPEKFDPERFSDENKHEINPLAYMPFGVGPRNCIGSRFALMEAKSAMFYLLRHFDLVVTKRTQIPMVFSRKNPFGMIPKDGFWVGFIPRKSK